MSPAQALAGELQLYPGRPLPTVWSSRPDVAPRLAAGRPAQALPGLLGSVFTLCANAHRLAARLAVAAAQVPAGAASPPLIASADEAQGLRLATARDQLARIALDWPRLLPGESAATSAALLQGCPLWPATAHSGTAAALWAPLGHWLRQHWLGQPPADWLQRLGDDPAGWIQRWCHSARSPLAALLQRHGAALQALSTRAVALDLLHQPTLTLPMLARQMHEPGFCRQPHWQAEQPDTGPWSRHADPLRLPAHNAWMRLTSRLVDLLRLAVDHDARWLQTGALPTGAGAGVAWVESARGLLVHSVRLAGPVPLSDKALGTEPLATMTAATTAATTTAATVADCRVLAPTEWNFHPRGLLAQALVPLHSADDATRLAVAFDPCVDFEVVLPRLPALLPQEQPHA